MTVEECTALLAPFALALRADMDEPTFRAYHRQLTTAPPVTAKLLEAALDAASRQGVRFVPSAPELRTLADEARKAIAARHPIPDCAVCGNVRQVKIGVVDTGLHRVPKYGPCGCKRRHQALLDGMGVGQSLLEPRRDEDMKLLAAGE